MSNRPHSTQLTQHACDRGRERFRLKPASVQRMAEMALEKGIRATDTAGDLKRYLETKRMTHPGTSLRIYGEVVFVFGVRDVLVTFWALPYEFKKCAAKIRASKRAAQEATGE